MMIGIIEDDRLLNQALNKMLTDKGYDTTCAHSREEALALSADRIDLLLIDIISGTKSRKRCTGDFSDRQR